MVVYICVFESFSCIVQYVDDYNGILVEIIGDEVMFIFVMVLEVVFVVIVMQKYFQCSLVLEFYMVRIWVGFYFGIVDYYYGYLFGDIVNVVVRVVFLCEFD